MRIYIYYIISFVIMFLYGGQVCPFIDSLTLISWARVLGTFFLLIFILRTAVISRLIKKQPLAKQTRYQFVAEFLVFILAGLAIATYNHFFFSFPPLGSGSKVIIGMLTLGSFLAIDMSLERERKVISQAQRENLRIAHTERFYSISRKISIVAVLILVFITAVMLLVIGKDIYWITTLDTAGVRIAQKTVSIEILFVITIVMGLVLNLIYSYSSNLKLFFENETRVLTEVNEGILDGYVPSISNDEFAQIAEYTNDMIEGLREKRKIKNIFGKVVSKEIARRLIDLEEHELMLGGQKRDLVLLVSDIRNFTNLTESIAPDILVRGLNQYFTDMVGIIHANGGIVDKFIGDGILAVFGLENPSDAAKHAVNTALTMQQTIRDQATGYDIPIEIGVGIHCGVVIAGNIGSRERLEFTFIGDPVNTAARIESMTKTLDSGILISETVLDRLDETLRSLTWKDFGDQVLKGKRKPVKLYGFDTAPS